MALKSDVALKSELIRSDTAVSDLFYLYHGALIRFLTRRLESPQDVDEVAQEVYLRIARLESHEELQNPLAFIFTVASNLLKDLNRRRKTRYEDFHIPVDEVDIACPAPTPEEVVQSRQAMEILERTLESLNPASRRAFILHRFKGMNYEQIAEKMGISKGMVKHHICSVLIQCREALREFI